MRWSLLVIAIPLLADAPRLVPTSQTWYPPILPTQCDRFRVEMLLFDVSQSMRREDRFLQAQAAAAGHIGLAPACSLEIIAFFGMTADVARGEFIVDGASRARLIDSIRRLKPNQQYTNLDEAAKLVELSSYKLRTAYGEPGNRLFVRVYSDDVSSPSIGKPKFSLAGYLAGRMSARHVRISTRDVPPEGLVGGDLGQPDAGKPGQRDEGGAALKAIRPPVALWVWLSFVAVGLAGAALVRLRQKRPHATGRRLEALLVLERTENPDGVVAGASERRVEVAAGVPAVFSTNANSATFVAAAIAGAVQGELFRIEPVLEDQAVISSPHPRLTVDGQPLQRGRSLKVSLHEPFRVCLGPRVFDITGVFARPRGLREAGDVFGAGPLQNK